MSQFAYNEEALKNLEITDTSMLDPLVDVESARKAHMKKDPSHRDKRMSMAEAVQQFVSDGDIWADTGFGYVRGPLQGWYEVIRQGKKGLSAVGAPNATHTYSVHYGTVAYTHASYAGAEMRGYDKDYSRNYRKKKVKIVSEWSHGAVALGFKAAQMGVPAVYSKQMLGSDMLKYNPYLRVVQNPLSAKHDPVVVIPALYPDFTIIHTHKADRFGNAWFYGPTVNDIAIAAAARKVIITTEQIVPPSEMRNIKQGALIPFNYVDAVVELPFGSVPGMMPGEYYFARQWWTKMLKVTGEEATAREFFDYWLIDCKNQYDFVEKLGGTVWIANARRQTRITEQINDDEGYVNSWNDWRPGMDPEIFY